MEKGSNYMTNPPGIDSNNFNQQDQQGQSKAQAPMGNPAQQAQDQQQIAQNAAVQQVQAAQIQTQQQQQQQNMTDGQQQAWINQNAGASAPVQSATEPQNPCRLIVNYIPANVTPDGFPGASVGYGFIEYTMPQEAAAAIRAMNRHQIENKTLKVSYARNPSPEIKNANMYVCGLSSDTDLEHLEALFRPFGTIITANLLKDAAGRSRCCGFVRMSTHSEALAAVTSLNGQQILGKILTVKLESTTDRLARKEGNERGSGYNMGRYNQNNRQYNNYGNRNDQYGGSFAPTLFVHGIPQDQPEEWIQVYFSAYGDITRINVPKNENGQKKPFGFVTYKTVEQAQNAINALNGATVGSGGKTLQVSFKTPRNRDNNQNNRNQMNQMNNYGIQGFQMPGVVPGVGPMGAVPQQYGYPVMGMPGQAASISGTQQPGAAAISNQTVPYGGAMPAGQVQYTPDQLNYLQMQYNTQFYQAAQQQGMQQADAAQAVAQQAVSGVPNTAGVGAPMTADQNAVQAANPAVAIQQQAVQSDQPQPSSM